MDLRNIHVIIITLIAYLRHIHVFINTLLLYLRHISRNYNNIRCLRIAAVADLCRRVAAVAVVSPPPGRRMYLRHIPVIIITIVAYLRHIHVVINTLLLCLRHISRNYNNIRCLRIAIATPRCV